jgi:hypothetical protein
VLPEPWDLWDPELQCTAEDAFTIATWMCDRKVHRVRVHFVRGLSLQRIQEWFAEDVKNTCLLLLGRAVRFSAHREASNGLPEYSLTCRDNGPNMGVVYIMSVRRTEDEGREEDQQTKAHQKMAGASSSGRVPRSEYCVEIFDSGFMGNMPLTLEDLDKDAYKRHGPQNELAGYVWLCGYTFAKPFHEFDMGSVASLQDAAEWLEWVIKTRANLKEDVLYSADIYENAEPFRHTICLLYYNQGHKRWIIFDLDVCSSGEMFGLEVQAVGRGREG